MTEKYNIESFLITYDSNSGYILYTYDNDEYVVTLEAIGTRTVEPISEEESEISSNYYFRLLASLNTIYQSFYIDANSGEIIEDKRRVQLEGLETYVKAINTDESFITYKNKAVDGNISVNNGIVYVEWPIDIIDESEEKINIQLSYISCIPLVVGQNYVVEFDGDTINPYHGVWECKERNGLLYLGDYNPFMEDSDDPIEPEPGIFVELQQVEDREDLFYSDIDYYIEYVEDLTTRYKININGDILGEISDTTPSKKTTIESIDYFYVGNLYLFTEEESDDTEENYLILSNTNNSQIYVVTFEAETIELSIDVEVLTEIKALEGATLLSFGRDTPDEHNSLNNYGIAINSSDDFLALPQRAISLFETQIHPDELIKVKYGFRGILGTLPELPTGDVSSIYSTYMEGTQGIYTDNMYLGNAGQYIAFYTDGNDDKHLRISTKELIYELGTGQGGSDITWEDYIDEKIGEVSSNQHFWFSAASTGSYVLTKDTEVDSEKTYYIRSGSVGNYTYTVVTPEEGDNPLEEGWYEAVLIPAGAYITNIDVDLFKEDPANNANIVTRNDGVYLKKGLDTLAAFEHSGLRFYNPATLEKSIELNSDGLALYAPNKTNASATLTSNGLTITDGSIILTNDGQLDNIILSNVSFAREINGTEREDLRLAIGDKFGVKNDGTLYTSNIIATGGNIGGATISDGVLQIGESQISDGAINSDKIEAGAVRVDKLDIGTYIQFLYIPTLLTAQPNDWATNWTKYYERDTTHGFQADEYRHVEGNSAPIWEQNKYYEEKNENPRLLMGNKEKVAVTIDISQDINNGQMTFWQNWQPVAYINNNRMTIPESVMLREMMVGQDKWSWREHDGNLQLKWIGD